MSQWTGSLSAVVMDRGPFAFCHLPGLCERVRMMAKTLPWGKRRCRWLPLHPETVCRSRPRRFHRRASSIATVFERFTDRAKSVLMLAQEESLLLNHSVIGTEHLLLGMLREGEGVAANALTTLGVSIEPVREKVKMVR